MDFYQIIKTVSLFGGMVVHFLLLGQSLGRKRRRKSGILFFLLLFSLGIWYFGVFSTYFLDLLFGSHNSSVIFVTSTFSIFIVGGLSITPSLLLHTLVFFFLEKELNFNQSLKKWIEWGSISIYFPLFFIPYIIYQLFINSTIPYERVLEPYFLPFVLWTISCFLMATLLCLKISRVGWETEERQLFFSLAITFLLDSILLGILIYVNNHPKLILYQDPIILVASLAPSLVFSYYVYRYNYMDYVIRRSLLYSMLITSVVLLYLSGVERLTRYFGERYEINASLVQSLLILSLVFAFRPFRTHAAEMLDRFFFKEHEIYKNVYRDLTQKIRGGTVEDIPALMRYIIEVLKKTMELDHASLVFFEKKKDEYHILASTLPFRINDFQHIIQFLETHKMKVLHPHDVEDEEVLKEMENLGAHTTIPIYSDNELIGLLHLGKKSNNRKIHSDELEILILLSNQLATEIQNMRLLEEKLRLERELLQNEKFLALGRLSASVAHQVKNPLSSIKIIAQVLREDLPPGDQREEDLSLVINEVDKLTRVVNQLLEFAKPARQDIQHSYLEKVIDEVVMLMQYEANRYQVHIEKEIPPGLRPIKADRMTLQDILSNLIQNSIQALEKTGGKILIKAHYPSLPYPYESLPWKEDQGITLEILDNGTGIPEENLKNIFEPFFTTKQQGTGLGLPIVKQRLESLGGKILIESSVEDKDDRPRGTKVLIWLPLA